MNLRELDATIQRHVAYNQQILLCVSMTTEVAVSLAEQGDDQEANRLEETVREYLKQEQEMKHHLTALGEIKNQLSRGELNLDSDPSDPSVDELTALVQQRVTALRGEQSALKTHPKWREFTQRVWAVHHPDEALPEDEDNEVIAMHHRSEESSYLCPITRALLVQPVRNALCGHVYSKEAMQQYLKGSRGVKRCPVVGCAQNVSEAQLEPDLDLERRIERMKKKNKRQGNNNANVVDL